MTNDTRRDGAKLPTANPQARRFDRGRGAAYDAAMDHAAAVTRRLDKALSAAIMEAPIEITTTGQLAALLARLDPGTPLTLQETIQAQGDWDSPGGDWVRSVVADHGVQVAPGDPPLLDDSGQEYAVLLPALTLGLRWRPAAMAPEPGMQKPVHACDRMTAAHGAEEALNAAADAVDGIARILAGATDGPAAFLPAGSAAEAVATEAARLRETARSLAALAAWTAAGEEDDQDLPDWGTWQAWCPECGAAAVHNGMTGAVPDWLCSACGHRWAAVPPPGGLL